MDEVGAWLDSIVSAKLAGAAPKVNLRDPLCSVQTAPEVPTKSFDVLKKIVLFVSQCIKYLKKSDKI